MKYYLLLLVFSVLKSVTFAQLSYVPFPEDEAVWTVYHDEPNEPISDNAQYMFMGDTLINGLIYNKLSSKDEYLGNVYDYGIIGFVRQDVIQKKVYFLPANDYEGETLLYDFDLNIGDSVPLTYHSCECGYRVIEEDSILLNTGFRRMLILFPDNGVFLDTVKIVEGIGSLSGILTPMSPGNCFEICNQLECFRDSNQILYSTSISTCIVLGIDNTNLGKMKEFIQPNPVAMGEDVNLTLFPETQTEISISDLFGNVVWSKKFLHESTAKIATNYFSRGIYLAKVSVDGKFLSTQKLVVQ
jgi:hypothetical protein